MLYNQLMCTLYYVGSD